MRPEKKSFSTREIRQQLLETLLREEPDTPIGESLEYDAYDTYGSFYDIEDEQFDLDYGYFVSRESLMDAFEQTDYDWDDAFDWDLEV
jgi:hypothetical protein